MSAAAEVEARRIAALLGVPAAELGYLRSRGASALARLRLAIASAGMERHRRSFERLARASALLPTALAARIAQEHLGPVLIAALAPFLPPARAALLGQRLEPGFLADVAVHLVPDRAAPLLAALPPELLSTTLQQLLARGEYAVMGTVVEQLPATTVTRLAAEIADPAELLAIAAYVGDKRCLRPVVDSFDDNAILQLLGCAAEGAAMSALIELTAVLEPLQQRRLRSLLATLPEPSRRAWGEAAPTAALA
ncbi:MAG: hypothetical protein Q8Q73_05870 [Stagnimonas sp.]|nr:hypothetical protein [Stagnimonas sp.]